ncbi:hypothetical protein DFH06DRAFT_1447503 [Mycena polygramma]|nr:hypothetical protein DFH06DRAFT_1447503 [Mycena polygramma]
MWSTITVPCFGSRAEEKAYPRIEAQLLRSGNASLDVCWLRAGLYVHPRLLDLILSQSSRWRGLYFVARGRHDRGRLDWLHRIDGNVGQLEKLKVADPSVEIPDVFSAVPKLRQVFLTKGASSEFIRVPWDSMTHYQGTMTRNKQWEILNGAPNLVECTLYFEDGPAPPETSPILLPNIRRLYVHWRSFLARVTTPLLEELTVPHLITPHDILLPFIHRSSCTLTKLALTYCAAPAPEMIALLQELPSLTSLRFERRKGHPEPAGQLTLFHAMTISGVPSDLCPKLNSLVYGYRIWQSQAMEDAFFAMVRSRFHSNSGHSGCLTFFRLYSCISTHCSPAISTRLKAMRDEGLDVVHLAQRVSDSFS